VIGWFADIRSIPLRYDMRKIILLTSIIVFTLLSGCLGNSAAAAGPGNATDAPTNPATGQPTPTESPAASATSNSRTATPEASSTAKDIDEAWKSLPTLPTVSDEMKAIYQLGLENGNDPHAFSILGDCQSLPDEFLGVYDSDPAWVAALPDYLHETVLNFSGSFDRYSPTVKDGTTSGALLWAEWNDNKEGKCQYGETPLECELRVQRPSIVLIHIGTHWETRNYRYLSIIIEQIIEHGAVPVLATKADNRELDERVNQDMAALAKEFGLPIWNFWATVQHLPEDGLYPESTWELSEEAKEIHRRSALEALDAVWRAVK